MGEETIKNEEIIESPAIEIKNFEVGKIYAAICGVMADISAVGKNQKNEMQKFNYRGIDDVMNALHPAMVKNKVFIVPNTIEEVRDTVATQRGGVMQRVRLKMLFTFMTDDGSHIDCHIIGEATDSGDKAINKAMSIAYKYACFQVFCIPTEEMRECDPDKESVEIAKEQPKKEETKVDESDKPIDAMKLKLVKEKLTEASISEDAVCKRYKINKIEELMDSCFGGLMKSIEATLKKAKEGAK